MANEEEVGGGGISQALAVTLCLDLDFVRSTLRSFLGLRIGTAGAVEAGTVGVEAGPVKNISWYPFT